MGHRKKNPLGFLVKLPLFFQIDPQRNNKNTRRIMNIKFKDRSN